jgi:hypothetical protein
MAGSMSKADLAEDLRVSLRDCASVFSAPNDADFLRFLGQALPDMERKRPVTKVGHVSLLCGESRYGLAELTDFAAFKISIWGEHNLRPWDSGYPGAIPRMRADWDGTAWWLVMDPAPTARQVATLGSACAFFYYARHFLADDGADTTLNAADRGLLILRAQVEAMREMALRNAGKPVQMRDGLSGTARNSTPAALHEQLLKLFQEAR